MAGAGILKETDDHDSAERFIKFLLSEQAQSYFAEETGEYPLAAGIAPPGDLPPIESLDPPDVDLSRLSDLQGTLSLLRDAGVIP